MLEKDNSNSLPCMCFFILFAQNWNGIEINPEKFYTKSYMQPYYADLPSNETDP